MQIGTIVRVVWESGEEDPDLYVVAGFCGGKVIVTCITEVNPIRHFVWIYQLKEPPQTPLMKRLLKENTTVEPRTTVKITGR